jgi:hypothetical protein
VIDAENTRLIYVETDATRAVIRRWQLILVTLAFVFPIVDIISVWLLEIYPDSTFGGAYLRFFGVPREEVRHPESGYMFSPYSFVLIPLIFALFVVVFNWPFFVLAARVKRTFLKHWPDAKAAQAAMIGGLTGLLIPYVFFYALLPSELILHGHHGAGLSLVTPLFWIVGGFLAYFGLRIGPVLVGKRKM